MTELLYTVSDMIFFSTVNLSHTFGVYIVLVHGGSDYTYCWTWLQLTSLSADLLLYTDNYLYLADELGNHRTGEIK